VDLLEAIDEVLADAVDVGDARTFADPDAVVDDAAEVLGELAVDLGGDGADALVEHDLDVCVRGRAPGAARAKSEGRSGERGCLQESSTVHEEFSLCCSPMQG